MKITNLGVAGTPLAPQQQIEGATAAPKDTPLGQAGTDAGGYLPSAEFLNLVHLVQQHPDVRGDRVQNAIQRLQQGFYHTPASTESTVAAILQAID